LYSINGTVLRDHFPLWFEAIRLDSASPKLGLTDFQLLDTARYPNNPSCPFPKVG
jgi:hypothetical protein